MCVISNQLRGLWPKTMKGPSSYLVQKFIKRWHRPSLLKRLHVEKQS
ncbi:hypothetical protein Gogos_021457, partial [Gossypium gossypioides]|nr:hypothetical protein [Gossypium gossypioides]